MIFRQTIAIVVNDMLMGPSRSRRRRDRYGNYKLDHGSYKLFHCTNITAPMLQAPLGKQTDTPEITPLPPDVEPAASSLIPSDKPLLAIEHPAILSSLEKGIKSLGGQPALTKVIESCLFTSGCCRSQRNARTAVSS